MMMLGEIVYSTNILWVTMAEVIRTRILQRTEVSTPTSCDREGSDGLEEVISLVIL